ncbi:signal transduction histidine kinase [Caulobacter ginsengisoli]|uniref:histidine kinase n=1 Tax=Caulobacter ginsengisoli TaxID=400775 RepID=A0ABU0IZ41_9CAUL|nr:ATP-binding protein [Caulobacter ginsengisoli]MDQ0466319.1 signal transduction histidine kinase [Caulobacter ginsengisoli]
MRERPSPPASESAHHALARILAWAIVVVAVVLVSGAGMVLFSAGAIDTVQARQEQALVQRTLARRLDRVTEDVTSASIWNDAVKATGPKLDLPWIDVNFGVYYAQYQHHDRTILFDPADRLIYASQDGKQAPTQASADFARDVAPLVARVRRDQADKLSGGRRVKGGFDSVSTATAVLRSGDAFYLTTASTVVPEDGAPGPTGPTPVVVSAQIVGPAFLARLEQDLGISGMRLIPGAGPDQGTKAQILGPDGSTPLAALTWRPKQPGTGVLQTAALPILGVLAIFLLAAAGLALRVAKVLRALTNNQAALSQTLEDLTQARDRAEAASVAKSQFLANISHEIRTPMNGVLGMAQVMAMGELSEGQRDNLRIVRESGESLLALLNDVLDLAKIEAGKLEVALDDVDVAAVAGGACAAFEGMAAAKALAIRCRIDPPANGLWRTDAGRLRQILSNLISNAIKFTPRGEVAVSVAANGEGLRIQVRDTGVGIPPERLGELFGKFNQIDGSATRQAGGSGLGLAISRELAVLLGGDITVESRPGEGSCFTLSLPAQPVRTREAA